MCVALLDISPRISYIYPSSVVTIAESNDPYGVLHIEPAGITVTELYQQVNLTVKRTGKERFIKQYLTS